MAFNATDMTFVDRHSVKARQMEHRNAAMIRVHESQADGLPSNNDAQAVGLGIVWPSVCRSKIMAVVGAVLSALAMNPCIAADPPIHDVPEKTVRRLIDELDADSRRARMAAERQLQELGPAALPHLPPPDRLRSPAARDAVRRVRELLEREQAAQSVRPSRVTLSGTFPLREILTQITMQTENEIPTAALSSEMLRQSLTVQFDKTTFWDCLKTIEEQEDVTVRFSPDEEVLEIVPATETTAAPGRTANHGAFRFTVRDVTRRPDFTDRSRNVIRIQYAVAAEPRLRPLFVRVNQADFRMTANESEYVPLDEDSQRERPADRTAPVPLSADFVVPANQEIDRVGMTGQVTMELATGQEAFVFRNLVTTERVVRRHGGVTVTLDRATFGARSDDQATSARVDIRVVYDQGGPAFESHRTWVYHNDAALRTADGTEHWTYRNFDTQAAAEAAVKLSYRFEDVSTDPKKLEFVYTAPTLLLTVPVDFSLPDLTVDASQVDGE